MRRRRAMPALISTIALIAGCGSESRVEVSGVVRDRVTGRAIAGARVVATDGSATRTDAEGRFTLSVSRGRRGHVRASARDHADVTEPLDVSEGGAGELELGLPQAPEALDSAAEGERDEDAVLRFLEEGWVDDAMRWARAHETSADGYDEALRVRAAIALLGGSASVAPEHPSAHTGRTCGDCHVDGRRTARTLRDGLESNLDASSCTSCHASELGAIGAVRDRDGDGLPGTVAGEVARARDRARGSLHAAIRRAGIERCGRRASGVTRLSVSGHLGLAVLVDDTSAVLGDCDGSGSIDGSELVVTLDALEVELARAAGDLLLLEDDASHGAHAPSYAIEIARSIESVASGH